VSFLIDPPWLYATGRAYGRMMPHQTRGARAVSRLTAGGFLLTSISLYLNLRWTKRIWRACRAQDGRDWMINSGVTRFDAERVDWRTHAVAASLFASYPLWLALGERHARRKAGKA
jgi:hypothetical protein